MSYELYSDVILLQDLPEEGLFAGDVGTLVEKHQIEGLETGYSVEFFDRLRKTIALVTLRESSLCLPSNSHFEKNQIKFSYLNRELV